MRCFHSLSRWHYAITIVYYNICLRYSSFKIASIEAKQLVIHHPPPPTYYEFQFNFQLKCTDTNIQSIFLNTSSSSSSGRNNNTAVVGATGMIQETNCFIIEGTEMISSELINKQDDSNDESNPDTIPLHVTSIQVMELDNNKHVISQSLFISDYLSGDTFTYNSSIIPSTLVAGVERSYDDQTRMNHSKVNCLENGRNYTDADKEVFIIPSGLQLLISGRNHKNQSIVNSWVISFNTTFFACNDNYNISMNMWCDYHNASSNEYQDGNPWSSSLVNRQIGWTIIVCHLILDLVYVNRKIRFHL